jgi:MFS family permease
MESSTAQAPPPPATSASRISVEILHPSTTVTQNQLRSDLRTVTVAWVYGAFWLWIISGAAMTRFAKELNTPEWGFGVLTAIPFIAPMAQFATAYLHPRSWTRKSFFMWLGTLCRFLWVFVGLVPWILPPSIQWQTMAALMLASWILSHLTTPVWMEWMSDVIPNRVRGRYFATRNRIGVIVGLIATLISGYLLDQFTFSPGPAFDPQQHALMLKACSVMIMISGLIGMMDILRFRLIHDQLKPDRPSAKSVWQTFREPLADANFRTFLKFNFTLYLGLGFVGQYIWLYVLDVAKVSNANANILLIGAPLVVMAASYSFWGKIIDKLGTKPVLVFSSAIFLNGIWSWVFFGHGLLPFRLMGYTWSAVDVVAYIIAMSAAFCLPGIEIANFNIILGMSGSKSHVGSGASYVAVNSVAMALGGVCSGVIASLVVKYMGDWKYVFLGVPFTYHAVLFFLSTLLRLFSLRYAINLVEPAATPTRDAFRYITTGLYNNVVRAFYTPVRIGSELTSMNRIGSRVNIRKRFSQIKKAAKTVIDIARE